MDICPCLSSDFPHNPEAIPRFSQFIEPRRKTPGFSYGDIRRVPCLGLGKWGSRLTAYSTSAIV